MARRQEGCFTIAQAVEAGFPRSTVTVRMNRGAWEQLAPRVLRVAASAPATWRQRLMAAALSVDGVASHRSAAALYGLCDPPRVAEVLVERPGRGHRDRIGLHSTTSLPPSDTVMVGNIRATTPARTLIDFATLSSEAAATDAIDLAMARGQVRPEQLERRARELWAPNRRGCIVVLRALATRHPELERARSKWETKVLRLCERYSLPQPSVNYPIEVEGRRRLLDIAWPDILVFLEFDGYIPHSGRVTFDHDRERQKGLVDLGWVPFRLTSTHVTQQPEIAFRPIVRTVRARRAENLRSEIDPDAA